MFVAQKRIPPAWSEARLAGGVDGFLAVSDRLCGHFAMQARRPSDLGDLEIRELAAPLRNLLFADGTVTRSVEAQTLRRVVVEVLDQAVAVLPAEAADLLASGAAEQALRRRVAMRLEGPGGDPAPFAWAESHMLTGRLPAQFLELLAVAAGGLGEALGAAGVESRRELLWCGTGAAPRWATVAGAGECVVRSYRIFTDRRPAMLVLEAFRVSSALPIRGRRGPR